MRIGAEQIMSKLFSNLSLLMLGLGRTGQEDAGAANICVTL
jgi:hypothetical protein